MRPREVIDTLGDAAQDDGISARRGSTRSPALPRGERAAPVVARPTRRHLPGARN